MKPSAHFKKTVQAIGRKFKKLIKTNQNLNSSILEGVRIPERLAFFSILVLLQERTKRIFNSLAPFLHLLISRTIFLHIFPVNQTSQ
jgi:hypothetical protein